MRDLSAAADTVAAPEPLPQADSGDALPASEPDAAPDETPSIPDSHESSAESPVTPDSADSPDAPLSVPDPAAAPEDTFVALLPEEEPLVIDTALDESPSPDEPHQ